MVRTTLTSLMLSLALAGCASGTKPLSTPQPERAAEINLQIGIDHLRKGNLAQAKEKIDRSLEQNPRDAKAHTMAGVLYEQLGDSNKADNHFSRAVSLDPENPETRNTYAAFLCHKGRYERGEKFALEAAGNKLYAAPELAYLNAGNCAESAGDLQRAEEHFRRAVGIKPRFANALLRLAEVEFKQADYMSARAFLERYEAVGRSNPSTLWLGVRIERGLGNKAGVQSYAKRLKSEYPTAAQTKELIESERNPG